MLHMPLSAELGNQIRTLTASEINSSNREVHHPYRADEDSCNLLGLLQGEQDSKLIPSAILLTSPSAPNSTSRQDYTLGTADQPICPAVCLQLLS